MVPFDRADVEARGGEQRADPHHQPAGVVDGGQRRGFGHAPCPARAARRARTSDRRRLKIHGGNQDDAVSEAWFAADRMVGVYWPADPKAPAPAPCPIETPRTAAMRDPRDA